jgi:hypothetical protein
MSEKRVAYFRNAAGEVHPVSLPALEAVTACHKHPHEWSLDGKTFAQAPEGFVAGEGDGGGIGRLRGASVRSDG